MEYTLYCVRFGKFTQHIVAGLPGCKARITGFACVQQTKANQHLCRKARGICPVKLLVVELTQVYQQNISNRTINRLSVENCWPDVTAKR